jgi:hypothetical protein
MVAGVRMTNGLKEVIRKLEQQRAAIERALAALAEVDVTVGETSPGTSAAPVTARRGRKAKRKGGMTPEGRKRLSEALKKRWAAKRAGSAVKPAAKKSAAKRKGGITAEGRARLSEALRKRWAAKRAAEGGTSKRAARK